MVKERNSARGPSPRAASSTLARREPPPGTAGSSACSTPQPNPDKHHPNRSHLHLETILKKEQKRRNTLFWLQKCFSSLKRWAEEPQRKARVVPSRSRRQRGGERPPRTRWERGILFSPLPSRRDHTGMPPGRPRAGASAPAPRSPLSARLRRERRSGEKMVPEMLVALSARSRSLHPSLWL